MSEGWECSIGTVIDEQDYLDMMWAEANSLLTGDLMRRKQIEEPEEPEEPEDPTPVRFEEEDAKMRESNHG
jgi:hypothetical protein